MENKGIERRNEAPKLGGRIASGIGNGPRSIVAAALLMTASAATAGIISVPVDSRYIAPESAPVSVQHLGGETFSIRTSGLAGEWIIDGSDLPPEYDVPATTTIVLPFEQDLELIVDIDDGTVSGPPINPIPILGHLIVTSPEVRGSASCLPRIGLDCGQLVVDLEIRVAITDPDDPAVVGILRIELLGSLA